MIPAAFEYERAETVDHAIELLSADEDAKILAGGHSLLPLMRLRLARPSKLVDIGRVSDLSGIAQDGDNTLVIGALTGFVVVAFILLTGRLGMRLYPVGGAPWRRSAARARRRRLDGRGVRASE